MPRSPLFCQGTILRIATCPWHETTGKYCFRFHGQARGLFRCKAALFFLAALLTSCAGQVEVPQIALTDSPSGQVTLQSIAPPLKSKGTEPIKIPDPNPKIRLPKAGDDFLYGLKVTEPLEAFYHAVDSKDPEKALQALSAAEKSASDPAMLYSIAFLRASFLIPLGRPDEAEQTLTLMAQRERAVFGKDFESTALRGELDLWRGDLRTAKAHYEKVLTAIGKWRVPTFYMKPPSNSNELNYFGRAQLRAAIGLTGVLIQEGDDASALAWGEDAEGRFLDILGLTGHMIYGKYTKASPDLYTSHGWCLTFLAAARTGYSKDVRASEELFETAKKYFAIEGHVDGDALTHSIREYVLLKKGLAKKPTVQIGMLPELNENERAGLLQSLETEVPSAAQEVTPNLPALPQSLLKLPQAGEKSPFGFKITPEYAGAFQAYLKGDGEQALSALENAASKEADPATAWSLSYLRAQVLIMMGRAADAEEELEKTAKWEQQAFGTNLNARCLRGDGRVWLGDYDAAIADFLQVIQALDGWKLPTSYVFPPADISQLALRSRAQLRAYVGLASAFMFQGKYEPALQWARASEELFGDLYQVIEHPLYHHYLALDPEMVFGRGINLGILASARLALEKDLEGSQKFSKTAKTYLDALDYSFGQVLVDTSQVRVLFDIKLTEQAEALADQVVRTAIEKGFFDLVWQVEALQGEIFLQDRREEEAEEAFRRAQAAITEVSGSLASDRSKRRFGVGKEDVTYRLVERDIQKGDWENLFQDLEYSRARAFVDMLAHQQMTEAREGPAVKELRELDQKIRRRRLLNTAPGGTSPEGIEAEKSLVALRRQKIQELKARDPEAAEALSIHTETLSEIQSALRDGDVLAYTIPIRHEEKIRFFLVDSKSAGIETSELSQAELRNALKQFQSLSGQNQAEAQREAARRLTQNLHFENWKVAQTLYIVPTGDLYFVPWGALDIEVPVVVLPTGSWIKRSPRLLPSAKAASVVGDPETGGSLAKLPAAREEAQAVAQVYGVSPLLGETATEKALREDLGEGANVLHLATHGFFDGKNPLDSAVILSTGTHLFKLTAARLFENPLPAKLVVLSGCETGLGQVVAGDDFLGLPRSFYLGGTLAVVYSLWPVADTPTKFFMEAFHREAVSKDYGEAWLAARNAMKQKGYTPSQYGGFILGGQGKK